MRLSICALLNYGNQQACQVDGLLLDLPGGIIGLLKQNKLVDTESLGTR